VDVVSEGDAKTGTGAGRTERTSLWHHRDFMLLWGGQTVSEVGSAVTLIALPLLAVISLDATTFEVGLLTACTNLAFLVIALPAGAWVDRWRRKPVLVWGDLGRVVLLGSIPAAQALGVLHMPQLYVVAVLTGVLTVFFDVAYQSYVPALVDPDELVDANGKIGASQAFGQVAGPSVAGVLVGVVGSAYAVAADALSFLISGGLTSAIRRSEPAPASRPDGRRLRDEIREGLVFVLRHPILKRIVGCTGTSNFCTMAFMAVEAVFMVRILDASPGVIGFVFSLGSAGGLLGGAMAGRLARRLGSARIIWVSITAAAPFQLLAAAAFPGWGVTLVGASLFAMSFASVVYNTAQVSYRQSICPPDLLGRMNASVRFIVWGAMPLGGLAGGVAGELIGVRATVLLAGLGQLVAALWLLTSPLVTMRDFDPVAYGPPSEPTGLEPVVS
jgi:MFS family permease